MKKITFLTIALAGLAFASCKKDRTCECTITPTSGTASTETTKMYKVKKSTAEKNCLGYQTTTTYSGTTFTGDDHKCTLK